MAQPTQLKLLREDLTYLRKVTAKVFLRVLLPAALLLTLNYFPYDTDSPARPQATDGRAASYYDAAYKPNDQRSSGMDYEQLSEIAANAADVVGSIRRFV